VRVDGEPSPCALADEDDCYMRDKRVTDKPTGAFWRLASRKSNFCEDCSPEFAAYVEAQEADWYGYPEELQLALIGEVRTDLDAFTDAESKILENHGYFMADLAIRRHAQHLDVTGAEFVVPHREFIDNAALKTALRVSHSRLWFWSRWFS
jgi:hypothetical protein